MPQGRTSERLEGDGHVRPGRVPRRDAAGTSQDGPPRVPGKGRPHGLTTMTVVLLLLAILSSLVMTWASFSRRSLSEIRRMREGALAADLARSALEEAWFIIQREANDPETPLFAAMRRLSESSLRSPLPLGALLYARDLPGADRCLVDVEARAVDLERAAPWPGDVSGSIRLEVAVTTQGGSRRRIGETRRFRVQRVTLPPPLYRWVLAPPAPGRMQVFGAGPGSPGHVPHPLAEIVSRPEGEALLKRLSSSDFWRDHVASFDIGAVGGPYALRKWLDRRLSRKGPSGSGPGRVNGVVFADNAEHPSQVLKGLRFRGKAILVLTGGVALEDISVANPAQDVLSIVCYGSVWASGRLDVHLLRVLDREEVGIGAAFSGGKVDVRGALIDLTGSPEQPFDGSVSANPWAGGNEARDQHDLTHEVVLLSPVRRWRPITRG